MKKEEDEEERKEVETRKSTPSPPTKIKKPQWICG